jgi:predicted dehydrogenase
MIKIALIGAGKMGLSHLSILGAHPDVEIVGVCDTTSMVLDFLKKNTPFPCYSDYNEMLKKANPEAVVVAAPTKFHYSIVKEIMQQNRHVFVEKPFCLKLAEGEELINLAKSKNLITQVGYHNKFIGTFNEVKRLVEGDFIGEVYHFLGEAYGPVVVKKKQDTWRSDPSEGGGCLMDYASHVLDLINYIVAPISGARSSILKSIYSDKVEDAVYSLLELQSKVSGVLSVNWSDETYRKMSTQITVMGKEGKIVSDANELKVYFKNAKCPEGYTKGWNVKYVTDLTPPVDFYLRGEEYSAQMDYFINALTGKGPNIKNTFESAILTDRAIEFIKQSSK